MHILLERAFIYPSPKVAFYPDGCIYDEKKGFWMIAGSDVPYILSDNAVQQMTKKCDVETGEDQKGE